MLERFCHYITEKGLFRPSDRILLAVSGGADSVTMCHLFHLARFNFGIAHCNFQLRGEESEGDALFVKNLAEAYHVPLFVTRFNTQVFAEEKKISIQMAARELRYDWFNRLLVQEKYDFIATAHHSNDVLETILLNFSKGMDIHGLRGIKPMHGKIIRPLLFAERKQIETFAQDEKLSWREDSSNESVKYQRNLIRHKVVPVLKKINPNLEQTVEESLEKIRAAEAIYNEKVDALRNAAVTKNTDCERIRISAIEEEKEAAILLFELIRPYHFNYRETINLLSAKESGKRIESDSHIIVRDRTEFVITPKSSHAPFRAFIHKDQELLEAEGIKLLMQLDANEKYVIPADPEVACLDVDKLSFPLVVREWTEGDWFYPLGMAQKKKLSDFLIDQKVPLNLKGNVKVLVSGENIAWVIGFRIDHRYKVGNDTEKIFRIKKEKI